MKLTTASFWTVPPGYTMVSIANSQPKNVFVNHFIPSLQPGWGLVSKYKANDGKSQEQKQREYTAKYVTMLNEHMMKVLDDVLAALRKHENVALVCWDRKGDFCHRHLVFDWLKCGGWFNNLDIEFVEE